MMEEVTVIPTGALTVEQLEQHNLNLECLLAALALKYGTKGELPVSESDIRATVGRMFSLDMGLPDGSVRIKALPLEAVKAAQSPKTEVAPELVFPMPAMVQ